MEKLFGYLYLELVLSISLIYLSVTQAEVSPLGCYKVDKGNPAFLFSAGDYEPDDLTVWTCLVACSGQGFSYAALMGQSCLCSDDIYPASSKQADYVLCTAPCSGDATENCGTSDYSIVYDTATDVAVIQLSKNETANSYVAGIAKSAPLTTVEGTNLEFQFDYGDGSAETMMSVDQIQSHTYGIPGQYVVAATAENIRGRSTDAVAVKVEMAIERADITCPTGVEINELFVCTLEVYEGSNIAADFDVDAGTVTWQTSLGSPSYFETGNCAQSKELTDESAANAVWVIPSAEFRNEGRVLAFEAYVTSVGDGQLDFLILRPTCSGVNEWCPLSNACVSPGSCSWAANNGDPLFFDSCSVSERYCVYGTRCVDSGDIHTCPTRTQRMAMLSTDTPRVDYTVVKVVTRTVAQGYNWLKLDDIATEDLPEVQVGDLLGFQTTSAGARVGHESVTEGDEPVEFQYLVSATEGSVLTIALGGQGKIQQHHVKAITSQAAVSKFELWFTDYGDFRIQAGLTNPLTTSPIVTWTLVGVQSPVLDLSLEVQPALVEFGNEATLKLRVTSGNPVNYTIEWGDGTTDIVFRQAISFEEADNVTHIFNNQDGLLSINVTGANLLGTEIETTVIMVQRLIDKSNYVITSNSPQEHPCYPCQTQGIIQFTVTLNNLGDPLAIGTLPKLSISSGTYGNTTGVPLTGLVNDGDTAVVDHQFRFPGVYDIYCKIYNLLSEADYFIGQVSIQIPIVGFKLKAMYVPPLAGKDDLANGYGPGMDLFPADSPVVFIFEAENGTGITVTFNNYGDGSPTGQTTSCETVSGCRLEHQYAAAGTYTISVSASNDITSPNPTDSITITIEDNIKGISVKELNQAAADEVKEFEVEVGSTGTASCLMVDYLGDESNLEFYGDQTTCSSHPLYDVSLWQSTIPNGPFSLTNTYSENGSYKLKITGFNRVSSVEFVHAFAIIDLACTVPLLTIEDHHPLPDFPKKYSRSDAILLEVITEIDCVVFDNEKRWTFEGVNPLISEVYLDDDSPTNPYYLSDAKTTAIRVPPHLLPIGIHKFTFHMTLNKDYTDGVELTNSISHYVEVVSAPLIVRMIAGQTTSTIVGLGADLELNPGKFSIDPNLPEDEDHRFDTADFKYYCYRFYENLPLDDFMNYDETPIEIPAVGETVTEDRGGCYFTGPGRIDHTGGSFNLRTTGMLVNMTHGMIVIVKKDGREGRATLKFTVKEGDYPQPTVSCSGGTLFQQGYGSIRFNPTSDMRLKSSCNKGCDGNVTIEWTVKVADGIRQYELLGWEQHSTGLNTNSLWLDRKVFTILPNATSYEFTVLMTNEAGYSGKSHVLMEPNHPPQGGSCSITGPDTSIISGETLDISCVDWEDSDGIENIRHYIVRQDYYIPINLPLLKSSGSTVRVQPPVGSAAIDYRMDLMVELSDKLGAVATYKVTEIEVRPNGTLDVSDPDQAAAIQDDLDLLVAKGNSRDIATKLQNFASLLNDIRENEDASLGSLDSSNDTNAFVHASLMREGDKAFRAYMRKSIIETSQDISLDSLEDVQLAANSLSVCSAKTDELSQGSQKILAELAEKLIDKVLELGDKASQDVKVAVMNSVLDNLGNSLEGVHHSTATPLSMVDKQEAEGGDFSSLKNNVDEGRGGDGSILFEDEDSVDVVPSEWLDETESKCFWPPVGTTVPRIAKMARDCMSPDLTTWDEYAVRVLGKAGTYEKARKKCVASEYTSNLDTQVSDDDEAIRSSRGRKRRPNPMYRTSSDEEDLQGPVHKSYRGNAGTVTVPASLAKKALNLEKNHGNHGNLKKPAADTAGLDLEKNTYRSTSTLDLEKNTYRSTSGLDLEKNTYRSTSKGKRPTQAGNAALELENNRPSKPVQQETTADNAETAFKRKVLFLLEDLRETQSSQSAMLTALVNSKKPTATPQLEVPEKFTLPLNTTQQFLDLENQLKNKDAKKTLLSYLVTAGGKNLKHFVQRTMRRIMTTPLALETNMTGRNDKNNFGDSHIMECVSITSTWPTTTALIDEELRDQKVEKAGKTADHLFRQLKRAQGLIVNNKVKDEPATCKKFGTMTTRVGRGTAKSVLGLGTCEDTSGGPTFPSASTLFENSDLAEDDEIDSEISSLNKNPRNSDASSDALADNTEVQNVGFTKADGTSVPVNNLKEPVLVKIARPGGEEPEMREFDPTNNTDDITGMSCHSFNVSYASLSITLNFVPKNISIRYELYIQYDEFPTVEAYDLAFSLDEASDLYDIDKEMFTIFLDDAYIKNNTGQYFVCIRELTLFDSADLQLEIYNTTNNFTGNYSMRIVQTGCRYWDEENEVWSSEGTKVDPRSDHKFAYCLTTHLSSFASAWIVPPTPLDFNYIFANAGFADNLTIYITTIVVYCIFFFVLIWARRKDRKDVVLLGVTPLPDNNPKDKYIYELVVCTGQRQDAGTESKVSFILSGDQDETDSRTFEDNMRPILKRSAQDRFLMATPRPLGTLNYMRLWHDNSGQGKSQSWYLQYIAIRDLQTRERYYFIINDWFSLVEGDGMIDRLIPVAGKEQMQSFDHVFYGHTRKNLNDGHLWFSIFARPAGSRFTRVQRAACCMMLLWLEMLVNIMWYEVVPPAPATNAFTFGPFSLSPAQVSIGIQAAVIVFPISLLVVQLFRKARPRKKRSSRIELAKKEQHTQIKLGKDRSKAYEKIEDPISASSINIEDKSDYPSYSNSPRSTRAEAQLITDKPTPEHAVVIKEPKERQKKKKSTFPWWVIIPAWILVILTIAAATTFTIFYGIQFGNVKTSEWLTSFVITTITGILFTQPIKVIALAVFIALVIKTPNADEDDDMEDDEEDFELANDEEWLHPSHAAPLRRKITYRPPDPAHIERMREKRIKELAMYAIIREIILYIIFLWVLMMISYGNQDAHAYIMKEQYVNTLVGGDGVRTFDKITTIKQFWLWVQTGLVPNIFAGQWYNGDDPFGQDHHFGDRNAFIVGYPVMRQVRVRPDLCDKHPYFEDYINECNAGYSISNEDEGSYEPGWIPTNATDGLRNEYIYTPWDVLDGYPFIGRHAVYIGGGYVVEIKEPDNLAARMQQLYEEAWVDRYTRAVFIEFSTYNAQVNLFAVVNLVIEFLPTGAGYPAPRIDVVRLITYYEGFALVQVCCEAIFLVFIIFFIVKEVRTIKKEKREYPKKFWNIAEWIIIGFSIGLIIVYFYRFYTTKSLLSDFKDTGGRGYVKLQYVAYWNELLGYMIGWVVFMSTVKFIKLLRFNRRMGVLSTTIGVASNDLVWFGMFFAIVFFAFVTVFYLCIGTKVYNYSDYIFTSESLITAILGKFHFQELVEADRILGPILFFFFMGSITFILVNMFLTIINEAFQVVKHDIEQQSNDYEMVDFMMMRFKAFIGIQQKVNSLSPEEHEAQAAKDAAKDTVDMFPDKVDQLLNHISKMYFNHDNFDEVVQSMGLGVSKRPSKPKNIVPMTV